MGHRIPTEVTVQVHLQTRGRFFQTVPLPARQKTKMRSEGWEANAARPGPWQAGRVPAADAFRSRFEVASIPPTPSRDGASQKEGHAKQSGIDSCASLWEDAMSFSSWGD